MFSLQNKVAVVTGGGSSIAKAGALLFSRQGAIVLMVDVAAAQAGAVHAITLNGAKDMLPCNIHCNSISPAGVHTPFVDDSLQNNYPGKQDERCEQLSRSQPIGRMASVDEVAKLILYLSSDEASFITGNDYPIDGGFIKLNN